MSIRYDFLVLALILAITGCVSAPLDYPRVESRAVAETSDTFIAKEATSWLDGRKDANGFYPLVEGLDAFGARLSLMRDAEVTIDAQYFLMKPDSAGLVFIAALVSAADNGVRVRLLLDDVFTNVDDQTFQILDHHPNIEIRIFNPIARTGLYTLNFIGNFGTANRRMHNKTLIIDNSVAIVGGRNIAVEYFQLESEGEFLDFDILAAGPIVKELSNEFDLYWNDDFAVPMEAFYRTYSEEEMRRHESMFDEAMEAAGEGIYGAALNTDLMNQFYNDELRPYFSEASVVYDDPQKLREEIAQEQQIVANSLGGLFDQAEKEIVIFTPYFIPGEEGVEYLRNIAGRGVDVVVITNSLATNNHTAVHSAYSGYRKDLLAANVDLWEIRANAARTITDDGKEIGPEKLTMHTKGVFIDRRMLFVGSLNFDPRSIDINTEMGVLIESKPMVAKMSSSVSDALPGIAYQLKLNDRGKIEWHANIDGEEVVETKEPLTTAWRRLTSWLLKVVPERQL